MDRETLKKLIQERHPGRYTYNTIDETLNNIYQMDSGVQRRTFKFLETGEIEDIDIAGYTIKRLVDEIGFQVLGAFLIQSQLVKNPEKTKETLRRGFDEVMSNARKEKD